MPGGPRSAGGAVDDRRLAGLIEPVVAAAGMDLESVRMTVAGRRRLLRVIVDSDHGVSLDDAADVSREVSAVLDASNVLGEVPYTLEVSSPGVDRPLTEPRHWRRARGRLVKVKVPGASAPQGRGGQAGTGRSRTGQAGTRQAGTRQAGTGQAGTGQAVTVQGRVLAADADGVTLDLAGGEQRFGYGELGAGAIQVEFGRMCDAELAEFSAVPDDEPDLGAGGDGH